MNKLNIEVEVVKLNEAINIANNENATEEEIAAALIIVDKMFSKLGTFKNKLSNRLKDINAAKQVSLELVYSNPNGDGVGVLSDKIDHVSVDMVGIHKDACANISVSYADKVYEQVFKPSVRANKKDVIRLAQEGVLPNATQRVKKVTVEQVKLFDYKEPSKEN